MAPKIANYTPLPQPIHAIVDRLPVTLCAYADVEGNSPSWQIVDAEGKTRFVPFEAATIADPDFLPRLLTNLHIGTERQMSGSTR